MRLKRDYQFKINLKNKKKSSNIPTNFIYPFFILHMGVFGASGFILAYATDIPLTFALFHGGVAVFTYLIFYILIFGIDAVKWMFINACLSILGVLSQIDWFLELFNKDITDYHWSRHIMPFLYFTLYTFLLRNAVIDIFKARNNEAKLTRVNQLYVWGSVAFYGFTALIHLF